MAEFSKDNISSALNILGIKNKNQGTSTGQKNFGEGDLVNSYSPVDDSLIGSVSSSSKKDYESLHQSQWEKKIVFDQFFSLEKRKQLFSEIEDKNRYHIIYFDAFGARVQPDLWTEHIFLKMYDALIVGGVLVTYSAKGSVRRAMQSSGFLVERLPGPPGKREMLRAIKF